MYKALGFLVPRLKSIQAAIKRTKKQASGLPLGTAGLGNGAKRDDRSPDEAAEPAQVALVVREDGDISPELKALGGRKSRLGDRGFEPAFANPGPVSPVVRARMRRQRLASSQDP